MELLLVGKWRTSYLIALNLMLKMRKNTAISIPAVANVHMVMYSDNVTIMGVPWICIESFGANSKTKGQIQNDTFSFLRVFFLYKTVSLNKLVLCCLFYSNFDLSTQFTSIIYLFIYLFIYLLLRGANRQAWDC